MAHHGEYPAQNLAPQSLVCQFQVVQRLGGQHRLCQKAGNTTCLFLLCPPQFHIKIAGVQIQSAIDTKGGTQGIFIQHMDKAGQLAGVEIDLKTIVIACGTVSTTALDVLAAENPIPVLGVVAPAARAAARATRSGSIGLIGTQASIRSGAYERLIRAENPAARVLAQPCPLFVPLVENGRFRPGDVVIETVAAEYLAPLKEAGVDTLVLGCTHYPLLEKVIGAYMGPEVRLINSGAEGARAAADCLRERDALAGPGRGSCRCFVSDRQEDFSRLASTFLGWDVAQAVEQVDISQY